MRIVISTSTTRALSLGLWPQAQAHRELAVSARDAQVLTYSRRGPRNFVHVIASSAINDAHPRFMQSTATALLILHVPRNITHRYQRTNDALSQLPSLTSGSSTPRACNQCPQCYGLDVFAARPAQFRARYRAICHQLCASSIYAVDSNRSAYPPCSAQYCASPSAHQRRALSCGR